MHWVSIQNKSRPLSQPIKAKYCKSYFCRLRGLMLERQIGLYEGLLLVEKYDSRFNAAVHMLFMHLELAIIWVNLQNNVVDRRIARPWKLAYIPKSSAIHILETHPERFADFNIGDEILIENI